MTAAFPDSGAGRAASWLAGQLVAGRAPDAAAITVAAAVALLGSRPADRLAAQLALAADRLRGGRAVAVYPSGAAGVDVVVVDPAGRRHLLSVATDDNGLLTSIEVEPWPPPGALMARDDLGRPAPTDAAPSLPASESNRVHDLLSEAWDRLPLVGLHAAVSHPDGYHHARIGWADPAERTVWGPMTRHRIGSITKPLVAAVAVALAADGIVDLDGPVASFLPVNGLAEDVTLRHLLTHTSGIESDAPAAAPGDTAPLALSDLLADGLDAPFPPGVREAYSNVGYALAGVALEQAAATSLPELLRTRVLEPLGMATTVLADPAELGPGPLARGVEVRAGTVIDAGPIAVTMPAAGGGWSTPSDMARLGGAMAARLSPFTGAVRDQMLEPSVPISGQPGWHRALGWVVGEVSGLLVAGHDGGWPGWSAALWIAPDRGWAVYLAANAGGLTEGGDDLNSRARTLLVDLAGR